MFEVDEERKRKYRTMDVSGDWTKDRLTAKEEMEYKRQAGFLIMLNGRVSLSLAVYMR